MGGDGQTVLDLAGTGTTIFSGGLFRGETHILGGLNHNIFGWIVWRDGQTILDLAGTGTTIFSGGLFRGVNSYTLGDWHHNIFGWIFWRWVVMDRLFWIWRELALQYFRADCFEEKLIFWGD